MSGVTTEVFVTAEGGEQMLARRPRTRRPIRASYDAAQTTNENTVHWANADYLSADAGATAAVRRVIRSRARYEVANNTFARGLVQRVANDVIGTGPRLQMLTLDGKANAKIEQEFRWWADEVKLAAKLRTMRMSRATDGEVFALLRTNPKLSAPIKLDVQLIECDRVTTPWGTPDSPRFVDGIWFDAYDNPETYYVQRYHPGSYNRNTTYPNAYSQVPADAIMHWYRQDRPGLSRGVSELVSALPLFAQLRRYTLAVIAAAETAADMAMVLQTNAPANDESAVAVDAMDVVELERRMATVLPEGWQLGQTKAEQPTTTYGDFVRQILTQIARCLDVPYNIAAGDSSSYNYASGRLDHKGYYKTIRIDRHDCELTVIDRIFSAWMYEGVLVSGFMPPQWRSWRRYPHKWFWDGDEHVDPAKEANAQKTRLANMTTTLAHEYGLQGKDWEVELRQRAKEYLLMDSLGLRALPAEQEGQPVTRDEDDDKDD